MELVAPDVVYAAVRILGVQAKVNDDVEKRIRALVNENITCISFDLI